MSNRGHQAFLESLSEHCIVGNSEIVVIAHGFLLSSVAQPGTRATHKVSLFVLIALLVILIGLQQLVHDRQFSAFGKHRHAYESMHQKFAARDLEKMSVVDALGFAVSFLD